jgi:hypothetical protein
MKASNLARLWRACNLTAFIHSSTGPVVHLFASVMRYTLLMGTGHIRMIFKVKYLVNLEAILETALRY